MDDARRLARRAYERARLRRALPWSAVPLGLGFAATWLDTPGAPWWSLVLAVALVAFRWRGGEPGRGAVAGLVAGSLIFVAVGAWSVLGACCGDGCTPGCLGAAVLGGAAGGAVGMRSLAGFGADRAVPALSVCAMVAGLACASLGSVGLVAVLLAVALPAPTVRWRPA